MHLIKWRILITQIKNIQWKFQLKIYLKLHLRTNWYIIIYTHVWRSNVPIYTRVRKYVPDSVKVHVCACFYVHVCVYVNVHMNQNGVTLSLPNATIVNFLAPCHGQIYLNFILHSLLLVNIFILLGNLAKEFFFIILITNSNTCAICFCFFVLFCFFFLENTALATTDKKKHVSWKGLKQALNISFLYKSELSDCKSGIVYIISSICQSVYYWLNWLRKKKGTISKVYTPNGIWTTILWYHVPKLQNACNIKENVKLIMIISLTVLPIWRMIKLIYLYFYVDIYTFL